jgi:DNA-binding PadR family transcriptional regulator
MNKEKRHYQEFSGTPSRERKRNTDRASREWQRNSNREKRGRLGGRHTRGRGGKARRGEARYVLLDALSDGPKHGYEIMKLLEERSSGQYSPSPGTVYPTLQYLEDREMVRAHQEAERRVYHLTEAGQAELEAHADKLEAFWSRFAGQTLSAASEAELGFLQDELEQLSRTVWRGVQTARLDDDHEMIRRVRLIVQHCQDEVRHAISEPDSSDN